MHIVMLRFSSMGDVVLQTATVNWLRSLYGKSLRITFVTSQEFVSLVDQHEGIDQVIGFHRRKENWGAFMKKLKLFHEERPIDLILDLHATMRSFRFRLSFWYLPSLTVDKRRWERFLLTKLRSVGLKRLISPKVFGLGPQVERILKDLETIFGDTHAVERTQDYRRGPHRELTSLGLPDAPDLKEDYLVVAPSASFFYKRWPISSFVELTRELLDKTNFKIVILAGPDDTFCEAFSEIKNERLLNLQGKTSLSGSMSLLSKAKICVGNDSGMNHIAEAYGVSCLTIFGPTDPKFGFAPHGSGSDFISRELWCKPCSTTGKRECFRERHYCMEEISVKEVRDRTLKLLELG